MQKTRRGKNLKKSRILATLNKHIDLNQNNNNSIPMPIPNSFFEKSKAIADDFIQSIVFLDDRAFSKEATPESTQDFDKHDFDASKISKIFADKEKICAVYDPETLKDIESFKRISKKADVVVIDWFIEIEVEGVIDLEADVDVIDPRGHYTLDILKDIILGSQDGKESLKLIIIYTGETNLEEITENIYTNLIHLNHNLKMDLCEISDKNIKILVVAKSSVSEDEEDTKFNHLPHLKDKIIKYSQLPTFILEEFTKMTEGLLSNFALLALTTIRNNSHKILSLFSKELDRAFLAHKSHLPNSDDAELLLYELIKDTFGDLLYYNETSKFLNDNLYTEWLEKFIIEENLSLLNSKGKKLNPDINFLRIRTILSSLLFSDELNVEKRFKNIAGLNGTKEQKEDFLKFLSINSIYLFLNNECVGLSEDLNKRFAILTHHKSLFLPQSIQPKLTLGTILKSKKDEDLYYICIQQKCDSVRIKKDEERKFLFLPLKKVTDNKFDVITPDGIKLKRDKKSFSIRTIIFKCNNEDGVIKGALEGEKYIFKQKYIGENDEQFEWVLDLKDLHSQRIVTDYAATLSRVGLDESEWLRRSSS